MPSEIDTRKAHHLDLCATDAVAFQGKTTLLDEVDLLHDPFPELSFEELDTSVEVLGKRLAAPLIIASMSGGTEEAVRFNLDLARVAQERQIGMGLGSMRPLTVEGRDTRGFLLREVAPTALLLGNLGLVQARDMKTEEVAALLAQVGADALCLHLNPAQERIQPGGDRDFRGGLDTVRRLARGLKVPVIAKETGCGFSRHAARRAITYGARWIDLSGAGGTSWVGVETLRATGVAQEVGKTFWDWGVPTAASLVQVSDLDVGIIATGGIRHGLDVARALSLGADAVGVARLFLTTWRAGGLGAVNTLVDTLIEGLKTAMLLTGSRTVGDLHQAPLVLGPNLQAWIPSGSPVRTRVVNPMMPLLSK